MSIVKCENKNCKFFEEGFYCTKFVVEMDDGKCVYWEENKRKELAAVLEMFLKEEKPTFVPCSEPLQYHDPVNDLS